MPARKRPTPEDTVTARQTLLDGLARDVDIFDPLSELAPLHPRDNTFPGEVFIRLAADALDWCGASRANPLPLEGLRERFLPECTFRGRQNKKLQYAVLAAAALQGGTDPDLLEEVPGGRATTSGNTRCSRPSPTSAPPPAGRACRHARHARTWPSAPATRHHSDPSGPLRERHRTVGRPITTAVRVRAEVAARHRRMMIIGICGCGRLRLAVATIRRSISRPVRLYRAAPAT